MFRKFDPSTEQWLDYREVCALTHKKKTTLYEEVKAGKFPAPVHFSPRKRRWALSWVQAHNAALIGEVARHNERLLARRGRAA